MSEVWRALVGSDVRTDQGSPDPSLRGRTYAISFERVWAVALAVADGGLRGWKVVRSDDVRGLLEAEAQSSITKRISDVRIKVGLDSNGQTRVDAQASGRVKRFMAALDQQLGANPTQILLERRRLARSVDHDTIEHAIAVSQRRR
jgi:hypothetical protein